MLKGKKFDAFALKYKSQLMKYSLYLTKYR